MRQILNYKFYSKPKIGVFATQWRLVGPIHVKLDMTDEHPDRTTLFRLYVFFVITGRKPRGGKI